MNWNDYQNQAFGFSSEPDLANYGLGLAGETGEALEHIKKHLFYKDRPLDRDALCKELGDVLWYLTAICSLTGLSLEDVAAENLRKLWTRHPSGKFGNAR